MAKGRTYALVMRKDSVAPHKLESRPSGGPRFGGDRAGRPDRRAAYPSRVLAAVRPRSSTDVLIAPRASPAARYALSDLESALHGRLDGLRLSPLKLARATGQARDRARRRRRTADAPGALTTVGYERPANLLHLALDNEVTTRPAARERSHSVTSRPSRASAT